MDVRGDIESKPIGELNADRPLSWGEREQQRRMRKRSRVMRWFLQIIHQALLRVGGVMRSLGMIRRKIVVDGVAYRERNNLSLRRAMSGSGSGVKEYDVRFGHPGGELRSAQYPFRDSLRIRYTHKRLYSDLGHDPRVRFAGLIKQYVRPGSRVLDLGCGTGGGSAVLGGFVGPSGGVVAVHRDGESIRFARQRWRCDHLAFELGWIETLEGELDGSFDVAVAVDLFRDAADAPSKSRAVDALCRVVKKDGVILVVCSDRNRLEDVTDRLEAMGISRIEALDNDPELLWGGAVGLRGADPKNGSSKDSREV